MVINIAYYEQNSYHTEIMGPFLEFFSKINAQISVYNSTDKSDTVSYFQKISNFIIKPHTQLFLEYHEYDKILIGTSGDTSDFIGKINKNNIDYDKLFFVCHLMEDLRREYKNIIVLSPLNNKIDFNSGIKYVLPIHNYIPYIPEIKKMNILTIVGRFKKPHRDTDDLINLIKFSSNVNFEIKLFVRHVKFVPPHIIKLADSYPSRIKIYYRTSSSDLHNYLNDSKYILPLIAKNSWYHRDRLSGSIALAYNYNIPMIVDNKTCQIYDMQGCIVYQNSITEIIKNAIEMSDEEYQKMRNIFMESKTKIIAQNNRELEILFHKRNPISNASNDIETLTYNYVDTPVEIVNDNDIDTPTEIVNDNSLDIPVEIVNDNSLDIPIEIVNDNSLDIPIEIVNDNSLNIPMEIDIDNSLDIPVEIVSHNSLDIPVEIVSENIVDNTIVISK